MSDKDRQIWMLNADLQAGRVKLPPDRAFKREYLDEWRDDRADAIAYAATATRATVAHRCALCSAELGGLATETVDQVMAAHHAVCPARPIEVGDRVRVVRIVNDIMPRLVGCFGIVAEIDSSDVPYRVTLDQYGDAWCHEVERIPRPADAKGALPVGDWVRWWPDDTIGRHADCCVISATEIRIEHLGPRWSTRFGNVGDVIENAPGTCTMIPRPAEVQAPAPDETCVHGDTSWLCDKCEPPAPVLVDGADREQWLAWWMENRLFCEGKHHSAVTLPHVLKPEQIDVARALWLERFGAQRSAALRGKVAASREAELNRVRVDLEVLPWE